MHVTMCVCVGQTTESALSFYHVSARDRAQVLWLGGKHLYTPSRLTGSLYLYLTEENWVLALDEALAFKGIWWLF